MTWKRYQNELIVLAAFVLMFGGYLYKQVQSSSQEAYAVGTKYAVAELKEVIALRKIWSDKKIPQKVANLEKIISPSKVKWSNKSKKLTAVYSGLTDDELNKLVTKILNLPVEIKKLNIQKTNSSYHVEFKCKW